MYSGTPYKDIPYYKGHFSCPILITEDTSIKMTSLLVLPNDGVRYRGVPL